MLSDLPKVRSPAGSGAGIHARSGPKVCGFPNTASLPAAVERAQGLDRSSLSGLGWESCLGCEASPPTPDRWPGKAPEGGRGPAMKRSGEKHLWEEEQPVPRA